MLRIYFSIYFNSVAEFETQLKEILLLGLCLVCFLPNVVLSQVQPVPITPHVDTDSLAQFRFVEGESSSPLHVSIGVGDGRDPSLESTEFWDMGGVDLFRLGDSRIDDFEIYEFDELIGPVWNLNQGDLENVQSDNSRNKLAGLQIGNAQNISQNSITILEGNSTTFTLSLTAQPTSDVTATITGHVGTDLILSDDVFTFTNLNWNTQQEITLTANQDTDAIHEDPIQLTFTYSGTNNVPSNSVTVTILDDEISWSYPPRRVREGHGINYRVELLDQLTPPSGDVTFTISGHQGTDLIPLADQIVFQHSQWQISQRLTFITTADIDDQEDEVTVTLTASGGGFDGLKYTADITITERVPFGEYVPEGESILSNTYYLLLSNIPPLNTLVSISNYQGTDLSVDPTTHIIPPSEFTRCYPYCDVQIYPTETIYYYYISEPFQSQLTAAEDADAKDDLVYLRLRTSSGRNALILVTIGDKNAPSLIVSPIELSITEGQTGSFNVKLSDAPLGNLGNNDVNVSIIRENFSDLTPDQYSLTFNSSNWDVAQVVRLSARDDSDIEDDDFEVVSLLASGGGFDDKRGRVNVTIVDNDEGSLVIRPDPLNVDEGSSKFFAVSLDSKPKNRVTVNISEFSKPDLTRTPAILTFLPTDFNTVQQVRVRAYNDVNSINESDTLTITASGGGYDDTYKLPVNVNDLGVAELVIDPESLDIHEGGSDSFEIFLTIEPTSEVTVTIPAFNNTESIVHNSGALTFNSSNYNEPQSVTVEALEDVNDNTESETITLTASGGGYADVTGQLQVNVIEDDEGVADLNIVPKSLDIHEGGSDSFEVSLTIEPTSEVTVTIPAFNNTESLARNPESLTFTPSDYSLPQLVTVEALQDENHINESETITLTASGGGYTDLTGTISITALDPTVSLLASPTTVSEEDEVAVIVDVSMSLQTDLSIPIVYEPNGENPATYSDDYTGPSEITILAGRLRGTGQISILSDESTEPTNETFTVALGTLPTSVDQGSSYSHVITILKDDAPPPPPQVRLSVSPNPVDEGKSATITATLTRILNQTITIPVVCTPLNTTQKSDYDCPANVTIPSGVLSDDAMLTTNIDEDTDNERLSIALSTHPSVDIGPSSPVTLIINDITQSVATLSVSHRQVEEGSEVNITVQVSTPPLVAISIPVECSSTEAEADDYTCPDEIWIAPREDSGDDTIYIEDDDLTEDDERFTVTLGTSTYQISGPSSHEVTILANDEALILLSHTSLTITEGSDKRYTVQLSSEPQAPVTIQIAESTGRITWSPPTLIFTSTNWNSPREVTIEAEEDDNTMTESTSLTHTASSSDINYNGLSDNLVVTIPDSDTPNLFIDPPTLSIPEGKSDKFEVKLSTQPSEPVTVQISTFINPELSHDQDILSFTPTNWNQEQTVTVYAGTDDDAEPDAPETLTLTASGGGYNGITDEVMVSIQEKGIKGIRLAPTSLTIEEQGDPGTYTVALDSEPTANVQVTFNSDTPKATFNHPGLLFTPSNWRIPQTVTVQAVNDSDNADETITLVHTASGGGYDDERADLNLRIQDENPLTVSIFDETERENNEKVELRVELSQPTELLVSVRYKTIAGTASAGSDYIASEGIIFFDPGSTKGRLQIELENDELPEPDERFTVQLPSATNAIIARSIGEVTILDDDASASTIRIEDQVVSESDQTARFKVHLSTPSEVPIVVHYRTENGTASAGQDYYAQSGMLTFAPGDLQQEIEVNLVGSSSNQQGKTFAVHLESASKAKIEKAVAIATINNDDDAIAIDVMKAYTARFVRTSTIQVLEAIRERNRPIESSCFADQRANLVQLWGSVSDWTPSLGELLAGCRVVQQHERDDGWFSVWGQGAYTRFHGQVDNALTLRGGVTTGMLGADYRWQNGWMAGLIVTRSQGDGSFHIDQKRGEVDASLTGLVPYVSVQGADWSAWMSMGYGRGQTEVESLDGGLASIFGAAGVQGKWISGDAIGLTVHGDVLVAGAEVAEHDIRSEIARVRVGLQGALKVHESIRPYIEANVRQDGGAAETGIGLELGGGVRFASGPFKGELQTQGLVMHTADGFNEWGMSGFVQFGRGPEGLTMAIRPSWGPTHLGNLHRQQTILDTRPSTSNQQRTEIEFAYGIPLKVGIARSVAGVTQLSTGRMYRLGTELRPSDWMSLSLFGLAHSQRDVGLNLRGTLTY